MSTCAILGFRYEDGTTKGAFIKPDGGYYGVGKEFLKQYINNTREEIKECLSQVEWVDYNNDAETEEEAIEIMNKDDKYAGRGNQILALLKTKDVEIASKDIDVGRAMNKLIHNLYENSNGSRDIYNMFKSGRFSIGSFNGENIAVEKDDTDENNLAYKNGVATLQIKNSFDYEFYSISYIYIYDMKEDSLEVYTLKDKDVETDYPRIILEYNRYWDMVRVIKITRDMRVRKILEFFDNYDINFPRDKVEEQYAIDNIDYVLQKLSKEK